MQLNYFLFNIRLPPPVETTDIRIIYLKSCLWIEENEDFVCTLDVILLHKAEYPGTYFH